MNEFIEVIGARQHNLKNISVKIPKNKLTVLTGVSGSGKSSLAFDTIYAEGQRRYVESLSPYARQFLGVMEKPEVDRISGLSPAIAIDQKASSANPRSTVATITEIYDYLRLLFARVGHPHCPDCGQEIKKQSVDQIVDQILDNAEKKLVKNVPFLFQILSPVVRDKKGEFNQLFLGLQKDGYRFVYIDGQFYNLNDDFILIKTNRHSILVLVDKISINKKFLSDENNRKTVKSRLASAVEQAIKLSNGSVISKFAKTEHLFSMNFSCPICSISLPEIEPRNFSFNSPHGACPICSGLGTVISADSEAEKNIPNLLRRYLETDNEGIRRRLSKFIISKTCPDCAGTRLKPEARKVTINNINIAQVTHKTISQALIWMNKQFSENNILESERQIITPIFKELTQRLQFLESVGLNYLTLDRMAGTLAGGESQRIRLASQIGTGLTGILYVLDEPTIGLHQRDNKKLIDTLKNLRDLGNTVIVVEHDREMIESADWVVDIGPGAGKMGGQIMAEGTPGEIKGNPQSLTGQYLSGRKRVEISNKVAQSTQIKEAIKLSEAVEHNLKSIDVNFPLNKLICITGVSGSGKSTLVHDVLYHALAKRLNRTHHEQPGKFGELFVPDNVRQVSLIDQSPIGRTPRSNPATYSGVFDLIRKLFTQTTEARIRGYQVGRFSFNVPGGRCEACEGQGKIKISMQFLPDVYVACDVCQGKRFGRETLEVEYKRKSIADVLNMAVDDALIFFKSMPTLSSKIEMLQRVGLGYIDLGQPAPLLSGGEAQRLKLSRELGKIRSEHTLYLLDEPTRGLHFADLIKLIKVLKDLVAQNNTVVVIEHNLDVIKNADWVIDLGPEGGEAGGEVVATGTPEDISKVVESYTGQELKKILK